jgi:hypothetical protein
VKTLPFTSINTPRRTKRSGRIKRGNDFNFGNVVFLVPPDSAPRRYKSENTVDCTKQDKRNDCVLRLDKFAAK